MDSFRPDTAVLDPAVRSWAQELVRAARQLGSSLRGDLLDALEAELAEDVPFAAERDAYLVDALRTVYRDVVEGGKAEQLRVDRQPFGASFTLWPGATAARKDEVVSPAQGMLPAPSQFELFRRYPELHVSVRRLRGNITSLLKNVDRPYLEARLGGFLAVLDRIDGEVLQHPTEARREFDSVAHAVKVADVYLSAATPGELMPRIPLVIEDALIARVHASPAEQDELGQALHTMQMLVAAKKRVPQLRELAAEIFLRARDIMLEGRSAHADERSAVADDAAFLEIAGTNPGPEADALAGDLRGRDAPPKLGELATLAWLRLMDDDPVGAVREVASFRASPAVAGAALLMASWRLRLADREEFFAETVLPGIRRAILMDQQPVPVVDDVPDDAVALADALPFILQGTVRRRDRVVVELGPGRLPIGVPYAEQSSAAHVISIEPDAKPIDWDALGAMRRPPNFDFLAGRAEEMAPFAAVRPIATGAMMVAPPEGALMAMLLSALIAVKGGGEIVVFQRPDEMLPVDFLKSLGLRVRLFTFDPGDGGNDTPPSAFFAEGQPVRMARITVKGLGPAPERTGDGEGSFAGVEYDDAEGSAEASGLSEVTPTGITLFDDAVASETATAPIPTGTEAALNNLVPFLSPGVRIR